MTLADFVETLFGVERTKAETCIQGLERELQAFVPRAEAWARRFMYAAGEWIENWQAAPEIAGHTEFLEDVAKHPLVARMLAHFIRSRGIQFAQERNAGRAASSLVHKIVKVSETKLGVVSRHARILREQIREGHAGAAIQEAINKVSASESPLAFELLIEQACQRDKNACRSLQAYCKLILPGLPSRHGRPMAAATAIHKMFTYGLALYGKPRAYTYKDQGRKYSDPQTEATRLALLNPGFLPVYSRRLLTGGTLPSSAGATWPVRKGPARRQK